VTPVEHFRASDQAAVTGVAGEQEVQPSAAHALGFGTVLCDDGNEGLAVDGVRVRRGDNVNAP
jgi:hypothetical protein